MVKQSPKYIFVSGGVMSGVGKGITTASIALLLKSRGLKVTVVKCENYLNVDAGLINPIEHGDPFLCGDGAETDMDIGNYEKFLDQNLSMNNFITLGQIYKSVIDKERNFEYDGEDVEAIPHVTDEIIQRIKKAGDIDRAEIIIVELGGTVGEYQNVLYYEAARIMKYSQGQTVAHIHVAYLPTPRHLGEPKTKPTQLSVKKLNAMGIHPDFIIVRAQQPLDQRRCQRLALFCSVKPSHIINAPDVKSVYELPIIFADQQLSSKLLKTLNITSKPLKLKKWRQLVKKIKAPKTHTITIAIVGKYFATGDYHLKDSYAALYDALEHAAIFHDINLNIIGLNSDNISNVKKKLKKAHGIIVPIGWGERGVEGKIEAIKYARTQKIPFLGLCYGMQLAVVEYARHVLGWTDAHTTEANPSTTHPVVHIIPEQERNLKNRAYGGTMRLGSWDCQVTANTIADQAYSKHHNYLSDNKKIVSERHRHRYEFNDKYADALTEKGLIISGRSVKENLVEIIELNPKTHPFFMGTQGHPEYKSRPLSPHPFFIEFLRAATNYYLNFTTDSSTTS